MKKTFSTISRRMINAFQVIRECMFGKVFLKKLFIDIRHFHKSFSFSLLNMSSASSKTKVGTLLIIMDKPKIHFGGQSNTVSTVSFKQIFVM